MFNFVLCKQKLQSALVTMVDTLLLMPHEMLLEGVAILKDFQAVGAEQVSSVLMCSSEMGINIAVHGRTIPAYLAHVGHLAGLVSVFHMLKEKRLIVKGPLANLAFCGRFIGAVDAFEMTLQLEWSGELPVTMLADGMPIHLSILLVQLHVVLHVVHKSYVIFQPLCAVRTAEGGRNLWIVAEQAGFAIITAIVEVIHKHNKLALRTVTFSTVYRLQRYRCHSSGCGGGWRSHSYCLLR